MVVRRPSTPLARLLWEPRYVYNVNPYLEPGIQTSDREEYANV
jgi:hypothetical protein